MLTLLMDRFGLSWWAKAILSLLLIALLVVLLIYMVYPWAQNEFFPTDVQGIQETVTETVTDQ